MPRRRSALATLAFALCAAAPASAWDPPLNTRQWRVLIKSEAFALSYDLQRIERTGRNTYSAWTRVDFRDLQTVEQGDETIEYHYSTQTEEFDCTRGRNRLGARYLHDLEGNEVGSDKTRHEWEDVVAGSVGETFLTNFCIEARRRYAGV